MAIVPKPERARVRMYQVGFGDCVLLSFEYAGPLADGRSERHVLFDCGSTRGPSSKFDMADVSDLITEHTHGHLDVLVATHRHRDHISGFGLAATEKAFEDLKPGVVVQPWTEDPDLAADATGPVGEATLRMQAELASVESFVAQLNTWLDAMPESLRFDGGYEELRTFAADQVANKDAVDNLAKWSNGHGEFLFTGKTPQRVLDLLPGVNISVLGPPTLEQHPGLRRYQAEDPDYWVAASSVIANVLSNGAGDTATRGVQVPPGPARVLVERLRSSNVDSLLGIVRMMDNFLNNTSLILLIEAGTKRMLFGGDAQIENWEYALGQPDLRKILRDVHLYKVGHHGSRNSTPRQLVDLWNELPEAQRVPMVALLSTKTGVHGRESAGTEVPRNPLVEALARRGAVYSTAHFPPDQLHLELVASLYNETPFEVVPPR